MVKDIEMSPEKRKRLSELSPITPKANFEYVPQDYREKENGNYCIPKSEWPVFTLKSLTGKDKVEIDACIVVNGQVIIKQSRHIIGIVKQCLVSWRNWADADGTEIEFKKQYRSFGELTDEALEIIPEGLFYELSEAIINRSELSEEEKQGL